MSFKKLLLQNDMKNQRSSEKKGKLLYISITMKKYSMQNL